MGTLKMRATKIIFIVEIIDEISKCSKQLFCLSIYKNFQLICYSNFTGKK